MRLIEFGHETIGSLSVLGEDEGKYRISNSGLRPDERILISGKKHPGPRI